MVSIASRFHRTVRALCLTDNILDDTFAYKEEVNKIFLNNEVLLGVYQNKPPGAPIMFTDIGIIYQYKLHYSRMNYSDFTSSIICMNSKLEASDVIITMKSGEKITLHVCGGNGKFRDVFEFGRFVSRVIEDQTKAINGVTIKKWTK